MYGMGDYFARLNPCIPESTQVPAWLNPQHRGKRLYGLNGCGCNGQCGSCGETVGMGLFDSFNLGEWGMTEWAIVVAGLFTVYSMTKTARSGISRVRRGMRKRGARAKRKADLKRELSAL